MKLPVLLPCLTAMLVTGLALARADANPDFEHDAKPILEQQPGLVQYVHSHFVVKETGVARVPGNGEQPPQPPFIFNARPRGNTGPFYLRLLIQPGPAGHILKVADVRKLPSGVPEPTPVPESENTGEAPPPQSPPASQPISSPAPTQAPAPAETPSPSSNSQPSADTPSGPIRN